MMAKDLHTCTPEGHNRCNDANIGTTIDDKKQQEDGDGEEEGDAQEGDMKECDAQEGNVDEADMKGGNEEVLHVVVVLSTSSKKRHALQQKQDLETGSTNGDASTMRKYSKSPKNDSHSTIPFVLLRGMLPAHSTMTRSSSIHPPHPDPYMMVPARNNKNKKAACSSPSVRLLPPTARTIITSTCTHPAPPPALVPPRMVVTARNKKKSTKATTISSSQLQEQQQEEDSAGHEASFIQCERPSSSTSDAGPERSLGGRGVNARGERNRLLARKRRERDTKWNNNMKKRIDQITDENEELRNKNKAVVKELINLGVDAKIVMSRIARQQPAPSIALECPHQNISTSSISASAPLAQYQPRYKQQLELSLLDTTNGTNAFQHADDGPPLQQLRSPLFFPAPALSLHSPQMIHPPQQHPPQQQAIPPLANTGHNYAWQDTTRISTAAGESRNDSTTIASSAAVPYPHQNLAASNALSSLVGTVGFAKRDETTTEDILFAYRQALMVSQEIMSSAYFTNVRSSALENYLR